MKVEMMKLFLEFVLLIAILNISSVVYCFIDKINYVGCFNF